MAETKSKFIISKCILESRKRGEKNLQVKGDTRYMKIQKPGSANGGWKTPLNESMSENIRVAMFPAVCESGRAAMSTCENVLAKTKN